MLDRFISKSQAVLDPRNCKFSIFNIKSGKHTNFVTVDFALKDLKGKRFYLW